MADYKEVNAEIEKLREILGEHPILEPEGINFKDAWRQIKRTGAAFKGTRYPDQNQHQQAWEEFQDLVKEVKHRQQLSRKAWEKKKYRSERLRDEIVQLADKIRVPGALEEVAFTFATLGTNKLMDALMGPTEDRKELLQELNVQMRRGWKMLSEYKEDMLGGHKKEAWEALSAAKERLDNAWTDYKRTSQRAWEASQAEWRSRVRLNLEKLEERRGRLLGVLAHKERHLDELEDKLRTAWSDSFRLRVASWIQEERQAIADISRKVSTIESWIDEERDKLAQK